MAAATGGSSSLRPFEFPGRYSDDRGSESIVWRVEPSTRRTPPGQAGYELHTTIRGVHYWGYDLDGLSDDDETNWLDGSGMRSCVLSGDLPCTVADNGVSRAATITFTLDVKAVTTGGNSRPTYLRLSLNHAGTTYEVEDEWFEGGVQRLEETLPSGVVLVCCATCLFSDYSPVGHGILGMDCHRGAKAQYLAVTSKFDYFDVPRTEEVMETHLCPEYERRIPGTGYRG